MANSDYHKNYWQAYKKRNRQISLVLTNEEYEDWSRRAAECGRKSVGQQIKSEALAYLSGESVPTEVTETQLAELIHILRGVGNNINQLTRHANRFQRIVDEGKILNHLRELESQIDQFVRRPSKPANKL